MDNNLEKVIEENQISTDEALAKRKMFLRKQSRLSGQFNSCWQILDNFSNNRVSPQRVTQESCPGIFSDIESRVRDFLVGKNVILLNF